MASFRKVNFQSKGGKNLLIRTAEKSDAARILEMTKSIISENIYTLTEADELNLAVEEEVNFISQHLEHSSKIILVAEHEGLLIGNLDFANGHRLDFKVVRPARFELATPTMSR